MVTTSYLLCGLPRQNYIGACLATTEWILAASWQCYNKSKQKKSAGGRLLFFLSLRFVPTCSLSRLQRADRWWMCPPPHYRRTFCPKFLYFFRAIFFNFQIFSKNNNPNIGMPSVPDILPLNFQSLAKFENISCFSWKKKREKSGKKVVR